MRKHIIAVGFDIPGEVCECVSFGSDTSLLDADVIVLSPNLSEYQEDQDGYMGKACLTKNDSGRVREDSAHWNRELRIALEAGKTVFVVMTGAENLYVHTGKTEYSGTGRNARVTNIVDNFDPYSCVPVPGLTGSLQRRVGERIKTTKDVGLLSAYWHDFSDVSYYQAYLEKHIGLPALVTQTGDKMVGGVVTFKDLKGTLILLPVPSLQVLVKQRDGVISRDQALDASPGSSDSEGETHREAPTGAERSVGNQFITALIEIDKVLREKADRTPAPTWANAEEYEMAEEIRLRAKLSDLDAGIAKLQSEKREAENKLNIAANLKGLLFEKGKSLESAILEALQLVGFGAVGFSDAESEFDSIITTPSGSRLLGEAEGKDNAAINIDKLSQLERNVQEDFAKRPDSTDYAKGVLFGNAYRLLPPAERGEYFTSKCMTGARRLGFALVRTPDLFLVAKFLKEHSDPDFAASCRDAILQTEGQVVLFPPIPQYERPK